jgi:hypothetical protein
MAPGCAPLLWCATPTTDGPIRATDQSCVESSFRFATTGMFFGACGGQRRVAETGSRTRTPGSELSASVVTARGSTTSWLSRTRCSADFGPGTMSGSESCVTPTGSRARFLDKFDHALWPSRGRAYTVRLTAVSTDGKRAIDRARLVAGSLMTRRHAQRLADAYVRDQKCSLRRARKLLGSSGLPARVAEPHHCRMRFIDVDNTKSCGGYVAFTIERDGQVYLAQRRGRRFKPHARLSNPSPTLD